MVGSVCDIVGVWGGIVGVGVAGAWCHRAWHSSGQIWKWRGYMLRHSGGVTECNQGMENVAWGVAGHSRGVAKPWHGGGLVGVA